MHPLSIASYRSKDLSQEEIATIKANGKLVDVQLIETQN